MDNKAVYNISYGLFVLTTSLCQKQNGCIINTAIQVTSTPNRIAVTVNKANLTHDMIENSGVFNISILDQTAPFDIFKHFGFQSGVTAEKIKGYDFISYAENSIAYLNKYANSYISGKVVNSVDLGTHTMFIADVTDAKILSDNPSATYEYYHKNIKPSSDGKKKGWKCKICGYVYEGEELPEDFVCPICKHGADDFEKIQ